MTGLFAMHDVYRCRLLPKRLKRSADSYYSSSSLKERDRRAAALVAQMQALQLQQ